MPLSMLYTDTPEMIVVGPSSNKHTRIRKKIYMYGCQSQTKADQQRHIRAERKEKKHDAPIHKNKMALLQD
jgi:predicted SprT family Zn-dependent metalloprotease